MMMRRREEGVLGWQGSKRFTEFHLYQGRPSGTLRSEGVVVYKKKDDLLIY